MADLEQLLNRLAEAKVAEQQAKESRIAIEEEIVSLVEDAPENGSRTIKGGALRCTVKFSLGYKANVGAIRALDVERDKLPLKFKPASYELDKVAYEKLRASDPSTFALVAAHVVTKPAKTSLALKL